MSTLLTPRPHTRFTFPDDRTATEPPEQRGLRRDGVRLLVATPGWHPAHPVRPAR